MRLRSLVFPFLLLLGLLAVAAPASASFDISMAAQAPGDDLAIDESTPIPVTVSVTSTDTLVCGSEGTLGVALSVEESDDDGGFEGSLPSTASFQIPAGVYGAPGAAAWSDQQEETFTVRVSRDVDPSQLSHTFTLVAHYDGTPVGGCQAAEWTEASGSTTVQVQSEAPEAGEEEETDTGDGQGEGEAEEGAAPAVLLVVLAVAAAMAWRRRGGDAR